MSKLFPEERALQQALKEEWYESIEQFTASADEVFAAKGKTRDVEELLWERLSFPHGIGQQIWQKALRLRPMMEEKQREDPYEADWSLVLEELRDICNYSRMLGGIIQMIQARRPVHSVRR